VSVNVVPVRAGWEDREQLVLERWRIAFRASDRTGRRATRRPWRRIIFQRPPPPWKCRRRMALRLNGLGRHKHGGEALTLLRHDPGFVAPTNV
jgi:hypothetical protein